MLPGASWPSFHLRAIHAEVKRYSIKGTIYAQLDVHFCRSDCTHTKIPSHIRTFLRQNYRCIAVDIDCSRSIAIIEYVAGMGAAFAPALSGPLDFVGRGWELPGRMPSLLLEGLIRQRVE